MVVFTAVVQKFNTKGEKKGWTFLEIPASVANAINPAVKKTYRIKGFINNTAMAGIAIMPMGEGRFILPLNKELRKQAQISLGQLVELKLQVDNKVYVLSADFIECLNDEPQALAFFNTLANAHKNYFSKWIEQSKTVETKAKRIALSINALANKWGYSEMIQNCKNN